MLAVTVVHTGSGFEAALPTKIDLPSFRTAFRVFPPRLMGLLVPAKSEFLFQESIKRRFESIILQACNTRI